MVVFVVLAIFIAITNFTIILVYWTEKKLRHSQDYFRLSLGFADIISGVVVLPATVDIIWKSYSFDLHLQSPMTDKGLQKSYNNSNFFYDNTSLPVDMLETYQKPGNRFFSSAYVNAIGVVGTLSLTVSIYLLTVSGIDRLRAISQPLSYSQETARRFALISSFLCWVIALLLSFMPFFVDNLTYIITSSSFTLLTGQNALIIYFVGLILPLFVTWVLTGVIYNEARKNFRKNFKLTTIRKKLTKNQRKLNFVLVLMVTAFSLSVLPTVLTLVFVAFIPGTDPRIPETYNPLFNNVANSLETVAVLVLLSNSLWNCLIYSFRTKTFRKIAREKYKTIWNKIVMCKTISSSNKVITPFFRSKQMSTENKTRTSRLESYPTAR